jgi:GNAT superfamily N-acetyltransferase
MSNTNQNNHIKDLNINVNESNDFAILEWPFLERRFDKVGTPGFTQVTSPVKAPHIFKKDSSVDVIFTLYRNEEGLLLGVHGFYYDESNIRHPLMITVHPEHRGKGIGTQIALYLEQQFIAQEGSKYGFTPEQFATMPRTQRAGIVVPDMYKDMTTNAAGAGFLNNIVDQFYNTEI